MLDVGGLLILCVYWCYAVRLLLLCGVACSVGWWFGLFGCAVVLTGVDCLIM